MSIHKLLKKAGLVVVFLLLFISCSDNPSSNPDEEAPSIPSLESIQPDLSYFLNNNPQKTNQTTSNFNTAKIFASAYSSLTSFGQVYVGFFQGASQSGAERHNGSWVWEYNYSYGGESASFELTSRESGNEILWDMTISYNGPEGSFDDYTIVSGKIAKDGMSGSWTFNSLSADGSQGTPLFASTWERQSDSQLSIETMSYGEEQSSMAASYTYVQNGNDFMITAPGTGNQGDSTVHWNTETQTGYYEMEGERKCWDNNFQDTACS